MGEIKETLRWVRSDGQEGYYAARATLTKFPAHTEFVLASDHDAAMAENGRELNRERYVVEAQAAEIDRLKAEVALLDRNRVVFDRVAPVADIVDEIGKRLRR